MVRISDARMSGTAYGTVVLHVAPSRQSADRSPSSVTATRSCSTARIAGSTADLGEPNSKRASAIGRRAVQHRSTRAATTACTSITSRRPTTAAISTS